MENKKYELRKELPLIIRGDELYRVKALKSFTNKATDKKIEKGDIGGYVYNENILSQEGTCWISKCGIICNNILGTVEDDAYIV